MGMNNSIGYYPGCSCSKNGLAKYYGESTVKILEHLGLKVSEIEDWNCCGSSLYRVIDEKKAYLLAGRNLVLAKKKSVEKIVVPCPACCISLTKTLQKIREDKELEKKFVEVYNTGKEDLSRIVVKHVVDFILNDVGLDKIEENVKNKFEDLKVGVYYGCQITRPYASFDDPEFPSSLERILSTTGVATIESAMKTKCCGGLLMLTNEEEVLKIIEKIMNSYIDRGAQCIVTACPLCHLNLELAKNILMKKYDVRYDIPILYFTQILGLSLGLESRDLGVSREDFEKISRKIVLTARR
ncbi:MAG: CoB--CoM heterodisulfide reductase iron-sulfur subunit B family protein [Nitrososphaerota archaeon]